MKYLSYFLLACTLLLGFVACEDDHDHDDHDHGTSNGTVSITFVSPTPTDVYRFGDTVHVEVDYTHSDTTAYVHYIGTTITDTTHNDTVVFYGEHHAHEVGYHRHHTHLVVPMVNDTSVFKLLSENWGHDGRNDAYFANETTFTVVP